MILTSRIAKPKVTSQIVDRHRLYRQLAQWQTVRAIVIHAPAGYGKSSLVSRWVDCAGLAAQSAWLNLDESNDDPRQFVHDVAAALDCIIPDLLSSVQPILEDIDGTVDRALIQLLNAVEDELADAEPGARNRLLVLDDLHRVTTADVYALLLKILEHGPDGLHLVLITRQRQQLPLARLRAHEAILTLSAQDLRFTEEETGVYLVNKGFAPPDEYDLKRLVQRSEGWITALQLAILSLPDDHCVADLFDALRGDTGWVAEFLTDEILRQRPPALRNFLLRTSILDQFNAQLCVAVSGEVDAPALLADIARADLFLITSNEDQGWFRYHDLFQELLHHRLTAQADAEEVAALHRRAGVWLSDRGQIFAAVPHLLAAGDDETAADRVEAAVREVILADPQRAQRLIDLLPGTIVRKQPRFLLDLCRRDALLMDPQIVQHLQQAKEAIDLIPASDPLLPKLRAEQLVLQACACFLDHQRVATVAAIETCERYTDHMDDFTLGTLRFVQFHLKWFAGMRAESMHCGHQALTYFQNANFDAGIVAVQRELAKRAMFRGQAQKATEQFQAVLAGSRSQGPLLTRELAWTHFSAGENAYWQGDVAQALTHQRAMLAIATRLRDDELIGFAQTVGLTYSCEACVDTATTSLTIGSPKAYAKEDLRSGFIALTVRRLVANGCHDDAWEIVQDLGLSLQTMRPDLPDGLLLPYALAYIARGADLDAITPLLLNALPLRQKLGNRFGQLHLLALRAWQQVQMLGPKAAKDVLQQASDLANETGYVRVPLDIPDLVNFLPGREIDQTVSAPVNPHPPSLTGQERRVLDGLANRRSYQEIATDLVVSLNTVRTHVRNIYKKLGVHRREEATAAARRYALLPTAHAEEIP